MLQPEIISFAALVLLTILLFVALQRKWIKDETLQSLATVLTIVGGGAAVLNFLFLVNPRNEPIPIPTVQATLPILTSTPTSTSTSTLTPTLQPTPMPQTVTPSPTVFALPLLVGLWQREYYEEGNLFVETIEFFADGLYTVHIEGSISSDQPISITESGTYELLSDTRVRLRNTTGELQAVTIIDLSSTHLVVVVNGEELTLERRQ